MEGLKNYTRLFLLAAFPFSILTFSAKTPAYGEGADSALDYNGIEGPGKYVLIYPQGLTSAAQGLAAWRSQNDNLIIAFVKVEDIYADPRFEAATPDQEIKNFLIYAYENWSIQPEYCCLYGSWDFIPPHICDLAGAEDEHWQSWYGCVAGDDDIPEISTGRVWATDVSAGNIYNAKVAEYETDQGQPWAYKNLFMLNDTINPYNPEEDWRQRQEKYSQDLIDILPGDFSYETSRLSDFDPPFEDASTWFNNKVNAGASFIWYMGVSTGSYWFLQIGQLNNQDKYPIYMNNGCYNEYTDAPFSDFITGYPSKGGIASIGVSAIGPVDVVGMFSQTFFYNVYRSELSRLGDIIRETQKDFIQTHPALNEYANAYFVSGDPALKVDIPSSYFPHCLPG